MLDSAAAESTTGLQLADMLTIAGQLGASGREFLFTKRTVLKWYESTLSV